MIISFKGNTGGGGGYVLPTATANRLGGIKVGSGLTVQNDGTLSAEGGGSVPVATTGSTGVVKIGSGLTIQNDGTLSANEPQIPVATTATTGVVKIGAGLNVDSAGTISVSGGTGGGGDYIVTEALSSITNPTEGMIAYVPAHYENRGATYVKFELNDTSEDVQLWYPDFIYFSDFNAWDKFIKYEFNATDNTKTKWETRMEDGVKKPEYVSSDSWYSLSLGSRVLVKVSGATIEFVVDSGLTISSTQNPDDKFTVTTSTGLTPVRGMTYAYHQGWILKDVDFAYDRLQDVLPVCAFIIKNNGNENEISCGAWGCALNKKFWVGFNDEAEPIQDWNFFEFSGLGVVEGAEKNYTINIVATLSEGVISSWNYSIQVQDMKPLDFIRIPVLVEDAVLTEDIEYEGQIVAHSGDTVATAGTILAETDLYNVAAYGHETYGKNRVIFTFVYSGDCSWNSEQQKVIVNEGPGLDAYGDLQNLHRVAVEGEPEDYYISATMDYNGTLYRGSWKQHDRYTRWITLSWEPIMNYWVGTQAQYNALAPNYDNNTLYLIIN